jgi:AraC family transcriptional regulator of adaptative response / DNA-3-methyladenine glycosylase II
MNEVPGLTRATLHRARVSRDARFDGKFYIAVLTTGTYCRPICPAPRCKKSNVRYYASAAAAAAAGYRPCRRCRPEVAPGSPAWLGPSAVVRRALRLIQDGALDEGTVDELALRVGVGARHLDRLFADHVGVSPVAVAQTRRLHFAKQLLDETRLSITQVAMTAGFGSLRRFNEAYRSAFRCTPSATRRRRRSQVTSARDEEVSLTLAYRPPYDWDSVMAFFNRRAIRGVEQVKSGSYARTIRLPHGYARLRVTPVQGAHALRLQVWRAEPGDLFEIATNARRVFDLTADPGAIADVLSADPLLRPLVIRGPGVRIPGVWSVFECAVRAVLGEGLSVRSARQLTERLVQRFGDPVPEGSDELTLLFPSPERLAQADLASIGLTTTRSATLRALARAVRDHRVNLTGTADEVLHALSAIPGVGSWAVHYVAMRALAEPDAFPCDRPIRHLGASRPSRLASIRAVERRAKAWRPWRAYAALYLWQLTADDGMRQLAPDGPRNAAFNV